MIFVLEVVGCCAFVTYAASLFFRFKSRETGIFMILGASKKFLKRQITKELLFIGIISCFIGALLGTPLAWLIWQLFRLFLVDTKDYDFLTSFAVFLVLFMFIAIICFAAVLIIGYIRCITIAMNNRQVYEDIKHLGASPKYLFPSLL